MLVSLSGEHTPYPFPVPRHHVPTLLLAVTGLPFGHVFAFESGPEPYSKWFPRVWPERLFNKLRCPVNTG